MGQRALRIMMVVVALVAGRAVAAELRVVITSGVQIQGLGISSIEEPVGGGNAVVFRGSNTTLTIAGRSFAAGDPLPAPLQGTFEEIIEGVTAGPVAGLLAASTGPAVASGIFLIEGATVTPLVTVGPADGVTLRTFTMNSRGDVAYLKRTGSNIELYVQPRATGQPERIAGPDPNLRTLRGFSMDENGAVAWMDRRGDVTHWDATHGIRGVGNGRRPTGNARRAVALHATYGLVFVSRDAVVQWNPDTAAFATVLRRGTAVEGRTIRNLYPDVGFLADGTVTVRVSAVTLARYLCVVAKAARSCTTPGAPGAGTPIVPVRNSALFRSVGTATTPVVRPGDVLPDAGLLADVTSHAVDGTTIAFGGVLADERDVLGRWRNGRLETLASDGQPVGPNLLDVDGRLFDASSSLVAAGATFVDTTGETVGAEPALVLVRRNARIVPMKAPRGKRFRDMAVEDALLVHDRLVVLGSSPDALFVSRRRRLKPWLTRGQRQLASIDTVDTMAASRSRLVFVATRGSGAIALYEMQRDRPLHIADLPARPSSLATDGDGVAFTADVSEDGGATYVQQLWVVRRGVPSVLVRVGDSSPVGAVTSIDGIAVVGGDVVFAAGVAGTAARHALLSVER